MNQKIKAVGLLSGGLDSTLAIRVVQDQGIEVIALNFISLFCNCTSGDSCQLEANHMGDKLGVKVVVRNATESMLRIVKNPRYGYGKNMNPCIDCRINMLVEGANFMREIGANFLVTGEVLGQRPMSQRREAMDLIERTAKLEGLILRPLSAQHLDPTIPEKEGWVDRSKLLAIKGRSRQEQISLADLFEIKDYPCPAGGCLLTDKSFGLRVKDLLTYNKEESGANDFHLLKIGRQFRLNPRAKVVVARNEQECKKAETFARPGDALLSILDGVGPVVILRGDLTPENIAAAASLVVHHSKSDKEKQIKVKVVNVADKSETVVTADPASDSFVDEKAIGRF